MRATRYSFLSLVGIAAAAAVVCAGSARAAEPDAAQAAKDYTEIQNLIARYVRALDTRDPDLYAGVFTADAVFDVAGSVRHGRAEIRAIVEGLIASRQSQVADNPPAELYHVVVNSEIDLESATQAHHRAYWQTVRVAPDGGISIGAMGIYDDELVKQNGEWLIAVRNLSNFAQ